MGRANTSSVDTDDGYKIAILGQQNKAANLRNFTSKEKENKNIVNSNKAKMKNNSNDAKAKAKAKKAKSKASRKANKKK